MNKKVCIVTWFSTPNFGTCLQAYALYSVVNSLGYDTSISRSYSYRRNANSLLKELVKCIIPISILKKRQECIIKNEVFRDVSSLKYGKVMDIDKIFHNVTPVNLLTLMLIKNQTDIFISGGDQIWNTRNYFDPYMFLSFANMKRRISYGTSIGILDFQEELKPVIKRLLNKYSNISVRELSAKDAISRLTKRNDIVTVLDPVFLLDSDNWDLFCSSSYIEFDMPSDYILCYFVGNNINYENNILEIKDKFSTSHIIQIEASENSKFIIDGAFVYKDCGPREFITLIKNASLICTDSFHAISFSIIFSKNFLAFKRFSDSDVNSQNSRVYDLLNKFNLTNRIYNYIGELDKGIDYSSIQEYIMREREKSLRYLINSLNNC